MSFETEAVTTDPESFAGMEGQFLTPKPVRRGEIVRGVVVARDKDGAWVSIGSKSEGIIHPAEMKSADGAVNIGDEISVYVLSTGRGEGSLLLSYDAAQRLTGWEELAASLEAGQTETAEVFTFNRGGLVVRCRGVEGFIPLSESMGRRPEEKVGQRLQVKVLEVNRRWQRLILSERAAFVEMREEQKARVISQLQEGITIQGRVTGIQEYGVFVDVGGADGLCPLAEMCWERGKDPRDVVKKGQEVKVVVVRVEPEARRVLLSLKRATPHPWETVMERYQIGQRVSGTVTRLLAFGALARVEDDAIEGLVHISELSDRRISHPKEVVEEGQMLPLKILSIDPERRHLRLSLRQAQEEEYCSTGSDSDG
ncbi:MAG: S1 RNA-binding domain-containing protein [Dehalococcoidia bacterium]